ncbi:DEAD/DEAH box helicase family protein [Streptomyces sp. CC208A]|uniref:DEAD/DEAH box helicase n=1 Tax=Streptomyces sp. CC208A TaxID=3044573 RepID=UPI0024A92197|nr:DEAD/DEAH box helicase family protein [Streptomyces sp. CC208A]
MKYELFDYQAVAKSAITNAISSLALSHGQNPEHRGAIVLGAPTGAGKTVIATAVIEAVLDGDESTPRLDSATFLWVTDDPSLNNQTLRKMMASSSGLDLNRLITIENDFDQEVLDPGRVYFLNIQKLGSAATLSKAAGDGRVYSLWDTIANTASRRPHGFVVVVDEAHRGMNTARNTRDTIVSRIIGGKSDGRPEVPIVWGISAVPRRFREEMAQRGRTVISHDVAIEDVRSSGLLKDQIILGHTKGVEAAESTLLRHAVEKIHEYERRWASYCTENSDPRVNPILVVQVGDKPSVKELGEMVATILEEWPGITVANIVHTFASHAPEQAGNHRIAYCSPEDVQDREDVRVVLCKTAITTGWDCPRAEVLVSMRVAKDVDLITQIMGRMVRTPLARRVLTDETLNTVHCILPKFAAEAVDLLAKEFEKGDEGNLAGGTEVVTEPIHLTRNPVLAPRQQEVSTEAEEDISWFGGADDAGAAERTLSTDGAGDRATPEPRHTTDVPDSTTPSLFDPATAEQSISVHAGQDVFAVLQSLPSYTIPRRSTRSAVTRLSALAALLTEKHDGQAIEPGAIKLARKALLAEIDLFREEVDSAGRLEGMIESVNKTALYERAVTYGSPSEHAADTQTLIALDARGIGLLWDRTKRHLPEGLAASYVSQLAVKDDEVREAMVVTIALAREVELPTRIEERASHLVAQWLQRYNSATTRLSAAAQEKFDRIRRESDRPLLTSLSLPTSRTEEAAGEVWDRHVLSAPDGTFHATFQEWEKYVLTEELGHGAVAWYRNPSSGRHSLQIPYTAPDGIRGLAPDFVFIHDVGGELRASLIDPHGTHLVDAVPKLKGISAYASDHAESFHRIQSVAKVGGRFLMLNHLDPNVREAIRAHDGPEASDLFHTHGSDY